MQLIDKVSDKEKRSFLELAEHKLKGPLTATKWHIEILKQENLPKELIEELEELLILNEFSFELIADFFILEKIRESKVENNPSDVNLKEFVLGIIQKLESTGKIKNTKIILKSQDEVTISIDPFLLELIVKHLIVNAIKFSPNDGIISISYSVDGDKLNFTVEDSGIGIKPEDIERIGEMFFRSINTNENDIHGSGLGMAIVKSILGSIEGEIQIKSEEKKGSLFTITLPLKTKKITIKLYPNG